MGTRDTSGAYTYTETKHLLYTSIKIYQLVEGWENKMPIIFDFPKHKKRKNSFINHLLKDDLPLGTMGPESS